MSVPPVRSQSGMWYPQSASGVYPQQQPSAGAYPGSTPGASMVALPPGGAAPGVGAHPPGPAGAYPLDMTGGVPPTEAGCCDSCCAGGTGACCGMPGEPLDPFFCAPSPIPGQRTALEAIYNCMDYTFLLMVFFLLMTVIGFAVTMGTSNVDNIFKHFEAETPEELQEAMNPYIWWRNISYYNGTYDPSWNRNDSSSSSMEEESSSSSHTSTTTTTTTTTSSDNPVWPEGRGAAVQLASETIPPLTSGFLTSHPWTALCNFSMPYKNCTVRHLLGSFGPICLEDNFNVNVFAVQLSQWTNARDTLWFLAMFYTGVAVIMAVIIQVQRHPMNPPPPSLELDEAKMQQINSLPEESRAMVTEQMRQTLMMQYQQQMAMNGASCCGPSGIEVYDTPFYEVMRLAWLFSGLTALVWTINLCVSFWSFSSFYISHSDGPLWQFWTRYQNKFNGTVITVTIYLAWPVFSFFLDLVVFVLGFGPWMLVRTMCKPGIGMVRPDLPLSQLPGYIRADMFFMDFQDLKRFGLSRGTWVMLTGSSKPFFECCEDPTVDTDPNMTALMAQRQQWQMNMFGGAGMHPAGYGGMGMGMGMPQPTPPPTPTATNIPQAPAAGAGAGGAHLPQAPEYPGGAPAPPPGEGESKSRRHRRRSSGSRQHADPQASGGFDQTSRQGNVLPGAEGEQTPSKRRHHSSSRHVSRQKDDAGESRHRHRSRSKEAGGGALPPPVNPDDPAAAAGTSSKRRHRSSSRSRSRQKEGGGESRHRHRSSRSRSKEATNKAGGGLQDLLDI